MHNKIGKLLNFLSNFFFIGLLCLGLSIDTLPARADNTNSLEEQVLSIIRAHPEAIIESVQNYQRQQEAQQKAMQKAVVQQMQANPQAFIGESPIQGAKEGKNVLFMFSDFQCPFCSIARETVKEFMAKYGDRVTLVYKNLPLSIHPQAFNAAVAAYAAGQQGKFWQYYDGLFANQEELGEELYLELAEDINLDLEQFDRDRHRSQAEDAIAEDIQLARSLLIQGTPFFAFNGEVLSGAVDLKTFEKVLAKEGN
ncbi:DsbA family protein [Spirulina sp. 06S082]|uniref:DsbA family protein n=1 Tax=Spirulina sp. 06S082 TaxID=3110248 RepID=UPI002B20700C|nr:DsbA family protein [Spirulina sp. 06S082]MEA5471042.1 DsbA family protein [Spirulina sp. 06S082]